LSLLPPTAAVVGAALVLAEGVAYPLGLALVIAYVVALVFSGIHAAARFRSLAIGLLEPPAVVASQAAYVCGFVRGAAERRGEAPSAR
jgi:hypothetical protein